MNYTNKGTLIGGLAGAGIGGLLGYQPSTRRDERGKEKKLSRTSRIFNGLATGLALGATGARLGRSIGNIKQLKTDYGNARSQNQQKWWNDYHARAEQDNRWWDNFHGVKTQAEAKQRFHDLAFNAHPDRAGGSEDKMKEINQAWQAFKKHPKFPKTAMAAFVDELSKIHGA